MEIFIDYEYVEKSYLFWIPLDFFGKLLCREVVFPIKLKPDETLADRGTS